MPEPKASPLDPSFKDLVAARIGLEKIKPCYTCGSCTGVCPVREVVEDFDPRLMVHMILLGEKEALLSVELIWFCCLCNCCYFVCPQQIKFSRVALELREMALAEGYVDQVFVDKLRPLQPYLRDLCRRTMFGKVKKGLAGPQVMPCWRKYSRCEP